MESRPSYTLVGLFVLLLAAGAVFFALWMGKFSERKKIYRDYYTYMFESVSGLPKNGAVKFMGVEIGKVSDIHINSNDPTRIRLSWFDLCKIFFTDRIRFYYRTDKIFDTFDRLVG